MSVTTSYAVRKWNQVEVRFDPSDVSPEQVESGIAHGQKYFSGATQGLNRDTYMGVMSREEGGLALLVKHPLVKGIFEFTGTDILELFAKAGNLFNNNLKFLR